MNDKETRLRKALAELIEAVEDGVYDRASEPDNDQNELEALRNANNTLRS